MVKKLTYVTDNSKTHLSGLINGYRVSGYKYAFY